MGEKQGDRDVKDSLIRDLRDSGLSSKVSEEKARKALLEADRRMRAQGKR